MMFLCSLASELLNMTHDTLCFLRMDTGVILIGDVNKTDHCLILTGTKGFQF